MVPAKFKTMVIGQEISEETEELVDVVRKYITCKSPALGDGVPLPWETRVSAALNGVDFKNLDGTFIFHDFKVSGVVPRSAPFSGGVDVKVTGDSFFDNGKLVARLRWDHMVLVNSEEEGGESELRPVEQVVWLPVKFVDKNSLLVKIMPLGGSGDEGSRSDVISLFDGPEPSWDPDAEVLGVKLDVSIDGGSTFLAGEVDFTYYKDFEWARAGSDLGGPMSGDTLVAFETVWDMAMPVSGETAVRFFTDDGLFEKFSLAECEIIPGSEGGREEEKGGGGQEKWRLRVTCRTPSYEPVEFEAVEEEVEKEEEGGEEKEGGDEGEEEESSEKGDEGEEEEEEESAPKPAGVTRTTVLAEVAYNGVNFVAGCGEFGYYPTPIVTGVSKDVLGKAGETLVVLGKGFFAGGDVKVKVRTQLVARNEAPGTCMKRGTPTRRFRSLVGSLCRF